MVKSRIFDNTQLLKEHPELPHYKEEVVCFRSEYKDRSYPANECYFNRELYMIFVLEGRSEILLNGEFIAIEPNMLLIHGANYLTEHLYSSRDIKFITLALSESMRTDDSYLTQITAILLATMRRNKQYTIQLTEYEMTGIELDCKVSSQVLINIFEHNTPLHDGEVIIRGDRITSATCYLPLSDNMTISKDLGTRHRAALGMSEVCDALVIVVSEETGLVSVASGGRLLRAINAEELRSQLSQIQYRKTETKNKFSIRKGWHRS